MIKIKNMPLIAFAALMMGSPAQSEAAPKFFRKLGNAFLRDCTWDSANPVDSAAANYERLTTIPPEGLNRQVVPFQESDLQTKPWIRGYEYVVVVNNSNSYVQNEALPSNVPLMLPDLSSLGIILDNVNSVMPAQSFDYQYGSLAMQVRKFGAVKKENNKRVLSGIKGAQTVRVYHRGQLIRVAKVSTGRHEFELRDRIQACGNRPASSYYSVTESGYYNFQELVKDHKSVSFDEADMPNSMFYIRNRGLALHEVNLNEKIAALGSRASGGCTRMDPSTAGSLFEAIKATQGATIPVIDIQGNPVLDAQGQVVYKNQETITFYGGTSRERSNVVPSFNALLIIQPHTVESSNPGYEQQVQYKYRPGY